MKPQPSSIPLAPVLKKIMPICFITGMAMEAFMVKTGFYDIATATEAERRQQRYEERKELLKRREAGESPWDELAKLWPEQPRS
ncbi:hypothetical protein PybrP1_001856 [[Pythium] brassicae (nom. inval.)]|nr:hypothetical protein PybrP1_001856 [[Pythium] brassicae (nom. inval.)]